MTETSLKCTRCQVVIPAREGMRFCRFCGGALETQVARPKAISCDYCGLSLAPGDSTCSSCAAPVGPAERGDGAVDERGIEPEGLLRKEHPPSADVTAPPSEAAGTSAAGALAPSQGGPESPQSVSAPSQDGPAPAQGSPGSYPAAESGMSGSPVPRQGTAYGYGSPPSHGSMRPQPPAARRGLGPVVWIIGGLAAFFMLFVLGGGVLLLLFWPEGDGHERRPEIAETGYSLEALENSYADFESPRVDQRPMPGVRVTAPAGALDRPRELRFRPLPRRLAEAASERLDEEGILVVAALEFDAGMEPGDRLRRPVDVSFDLQELGVDPWLARRAGLMAEADGAFIPLTTRRDGATLEWSTIKNGPVFIIVGLSTICGLLKYGIIDPDRRAETEGRRWDGFMSREGHFEVLWPEGRHGDEEGRALAVFSTLEELWDEYRVAKRTGRLPPPPAPGVPRRHSNFDAYFRDLKARIEKLEAKVGDRDWQERYWAPRPAVAVAEFLDHAHGYLTSRGFNAPPQATRVYLRDPWSHGPNIKGLAENTMTRRPFISIDYHSIPGTRRGEQLSGEQGVDVMVTLVHELFHIFQSGYGRSEYLDRNSYWIGEATALTMEHEMWSDFSDRFRNRDWYRRALTARQPYWYAYRSPMEPSGLSGFGVLTFRDNESLQRHGYGQSFFFEHLKKKAYPGDERAFLRDFYDELNRTRTAAGALQSLMTTRTRKGLADHFADFVIENARDIAATPSVEDDQELSVGSQRRVFSWNWSDVPPLSSPIYLLEIPQSTSGYDKSVLVLEVEQPLRDVRLRWRGLAARDWSDVSHARIVVPRLSPFGTGARRRGGILLQAIGAYMPGAGDLGRGGFRATFLLPPEKAPRLPQGPRLEPEALSREEREGLKIRWERSALAGESRYRSSHDGARLGPGAPRHTPFSRGADHDKRYGHGRFRHGIEIETWVGGERVDRTTVVAGPHADEAIVPWAEVTPKRPEQRAGGFDLRVRMRDILFFGEEEQVRGELGEEAVLTIGPATCEDTVYRVTVPHGSTGRSRKKQYAFMMMPKEEVVRAMASRKGSPLSHGEDERLLAESFRATLGDPQDRRAVNEAVPAACFDLLMSRDLFIMWHGTYTEYGSGGQVSYQAEFERGFRSRTVSVDRKESVVRPGANPFGGVAPKID